LPAIDRVQALAGKHSLTFRVRRYRYAFAVYKAISLHTYSNETRAPVANPPNSAQLDGTA